MYPDCFTKIAVKDAFNNWGRDFSDIVELHPPNNVCMQAQKIK